jgi:glycosyltransferase involved in cell wall biosynthesis
MNSPIFLSIVTPTYNEEETIRECILKVESVMASAKPSIAYEHIIIDNYSTDRTVEIALELSKTTRAVVIARNDKNIGPSKTIYRGLNLTQGEWVVPMLPADLQDPAETILEFISSIKEETNVVFGIRENRQEFFLMKLLRSTYYRIIRRLSFSDIPLNSGDFCLIHRTVVDSLIELQDENPYLRGLIAQAANSPQSVHYTWGRRNGGKSKASPLILAELAISGLVSTSQIPARIALIIGFAISACSGVVAFAQALIVLLSGKAATPGIATIVVAIFFFGGLQLFFTGIIGEYVLSIHRQIKKSPKIQTRLLNNE